ncbi:DUF2577 domain-containing protein [Cohnella thailandensis]|uniref:DUF2577 domain-containing protein n=1 Tax=Cohnella thailandensis TaxID=557557 RepID=A0A841SU63_9BACL|nr:DUF2577 domain-containing protein [Cohnella thailandensis]MBB6633565.1 DUF2577 domain-containing protein [Cohnella thailandensis]MBP1974583.1 hypothetical protein [Cohnella thailandensis]
MSRLLQVIKQAGAGAVGASQPVAILTGTVVKIDPLEVTVDQRFTLMADFLIVPESLTEYKIEELLIRKRLETGDKLILLRVQGGNQYLILDRAVET